MYVYSQNPTAVEEVTLHDFENACKVTSYISQGKCIVVLYRPMPWPAQLTSNDFTR
jgi:hypothetical protein